MGKWNAPLEESVADELSEKYGRKIKYQCPEKITYYSKRYNKKIVVRKGYYSDGATGAFDVDTRAWWVHDVLCDTGRFADGTHCNNWQASAILHDVLLEDGYWIRARRWRFWTWLFGGGKARDNGMF